MVALIFLKNQNQSLREMYLLNVRCLGGKGRLASRRRRSGKFRAADAQAGGRFCGAIVTQIAQDLLLLARILSGEPGECVGDDVAMMQVGHRRIAAHIEP